MAAILLGELPTSGVTAKLMTVAYINVVFRMSPDAALAAQFYELDGM